MKQLTKSQIFNIYRLFYFWYSRRQIAKILKHWRNTIAKYLSPVAFSEEYMDSHYDIEYYKAEIEYQSSMKSLWKSLAIIGAIGHVLVLLSYFFI